MPTRRNNLDCASLRQLLDLMIARRGHRRERYKEELIRSIETLITRIATLEGQIERLRLNIEILELDRQKLMGVNATAEGEVSPPGGRCIPGEVPSVPGSGPGTQADTPH